MAHLSPLIRYVGIGALLLLFPGCLRTIADSAPEAELPLATGAAEKLGIADPNAALSLAKIETELTTSTTTRDEAGKSVTTVTDGWYRQLALDGQTLLPAGTYRWRND